MTHRKWEIMFYASCSLAILMFGFFCLFMYKAQQWSSRADEAFTGMMTTGRSSSDAWISAADNAAAYSHFAYGFAMMTGVFAAFIWVASLMLRTPSIVSSNNPRSHT